MKATVEDLKTLDRATLATKYQVSEKTVIRWLKEQGFYQPIRNCGRRLADTQVDEIRKRYKSGESRKELAAQFGVTIVTIGRIINQVTHPKNECTAIVSMIYNIE